MNNNNSILNIKQILVYTSMGMSFPGQGLHEVTKATNSNSVVSRE